MVNRKGGDEIKLLKMIAKTQTVQANVTRERQKSVHYSAKRPRARLPDHVNGFTFRSVTGQGGLGTRVSTVMS